MGWIRRERVTWAEAAYAGIEMTNDARDLLAWAAAERPAQLARVWARGQPLQRADAAPVLVALLEAWRAEGKPGPERKPVAERREGRQP